jgi:hypothetical protein
MESATASCDGSNKKNSAAIGILGIGLGIAETPAVTTAHATVAISVPAAPAATAFHLTTVFIDQRALFVAEQAMYLFPRATIETNFLHLRNLFVTEVQFLLKLCLTVDPAMTTKAFST